ncbi:hypothetical protein RJ639_002814 [Escallonia herrerae]|uniref:B box-type domain-containing protein n=1 Tax=Escallonia herrerae TaxID=1293975 RepID=A0AA88W114_9ASTE|nr:hypothetical protein RJ639_002814 [Escallonia herrerae]
MKRCELCKSPARIYCESDAASLCWGCDGKVHSANFLVARHARTLLCHVCQAPTAWSAAGQKLGRTVSVCERCVSVRGGIKNGVADVESQGGNDGGIDSDGDYEEEEDEDDDGDEFDVDEEEDDGENQVVPWSSTTPPPPAESSSSSEESSSSLCNGDEDVSSKRMRENVADLSYDDDPGCSSYLRKNRTPPPTAATRSSGEPDTVDSLTVRPSKMRRIEATESTRAQHTAAGSRSLGIAESLQRLHRECWCKRAGGDRRYL